jgi:preprotein translocase subunit SecA
MLNSLARNRPLDRALFSPGGASNSVPIVDTPSPDVVSNIQDRLESFPNSTSPSTLSRFWGKLTRGSRWVELQEVKRLESAAGALKTPQDFQTKTAQFQKRLQSGETFESLRAEVYAVASRACQVATGMTPYDCQKLGALAMGSGEIAEMMTGEGKTLSAVMPLYLHALAGEGAHLVTVNDTLAQRDAKEMGPVFELLGLSVGCVLETMSPEEKRAGYAADVTYTTDRALGFDYLRDRTAMSVDERVQRPPFFALVDEVDEVLLDEARTPLIISGPGEAPSQDYQLFDDIVDDLKPGIDYFVDREQGAAWLSELGLEYVENELFGKAVSRKDPELLAEYHRKAGALRAEGKAYRSLLEHQKEKPGFWNGLFHHQWSDQEQTLQTAYQQASERTDAFPDHFLLHEQENEHQIRFLNASLKAHALFQEGVDYIVQDQRVKIVDENKGRTSQGRRFNEGLHQALEAKSGVPLRPESRPIASITYPNLFKHYTHLAGMSGTAKSSEAEFQKLYGLSVTEVPTNLQFETNPAAPQKAQRHARIDQPDAVFSTKKEKFGAVVAEAIRAYEEGIPVLLGTLSVEANNYLYGQLLAHGVNPAALQVLNAEHVRGDKSLENSIIAQAGRSGMITVATNMAGRGVNIKPDLTNYKKLAMKVEELAGNGNKPVVVDVASQKEADKLAQWLEARFPETIIRVASEEPVPAGLEHLKSEDFPTGGLYVIGTERAKSRRIDDQLIGRAGRQGKPGRSQFFLSLEDELIHELAKHNLAKSLEMISETGAQSDFVDGLVRKSQERLAEMDLHSREQSGLYDKVLDRQREAFYDIRDSILNPESDLKYKLVEDSKDFLAQEVRSCLTTSGKHSASEIRTVLNQLEEQLKVSLKWPGERSGKVDEVVESVTAQLDQELNSAFAQFDVSGVDLENVYRQVLLGHCDHQWSNHLESMAHLKQGIHWVSTVGEKPEDAYKRRGFETFEATLDSIRDQSVLENVPQIMVGAKILKRDRELATNFSGEVS